MNIEQTASGDLIVSFQDVKTDADRAFAHQVLARWEVAPIMLKAAGGLVAVLGERKFRGEDAAGIRTMIVEIEALIAGVGAKMYADPIQVIDDLQLESDHQDDVADPPIGPSE